MPKERFRTASQLFVNFPAFGFLANPNLAPETSKGYDAGFEQPLGKTINAVATYNQNGIES